MTYATVEGPSISQYPVAAGDLVTRVLDCRGGDTTVVCLHGAGSRADRFWHNIAPVAAAGYRVIAMDFPGHGYATKGASVTHSTPAFAGFVIEVLRALDVQRPVIVGTSLGAHVAAAIAADDPEAVSALVLIGAVGIVPAEPRDGPLSPIPMWDASPDAIRTKLRMVVADPALITDEWVNEESHINSSPGARESLEAVADYLGNGVERDSVGDRLLERASHVPTLLVWGGEDRWVPPSVGFRTKELLAGPELVVMPGTGHAPYYEDPETFNRLLIDFFAGRRVAGQVAAGAVRGGAEQESGPDGPRQRGSA
jgi:2-hydroxy-6-oxonona-2,4-dienedioate hydrolase